MKTAREYSVHEAVVAVLKPEPEEDAESGEERVPEALGSLGPDEGA